MIFFVVLCWNCYFECAWSCSNVWVEIKSRILLRIVIFLIAENTISSTLRMEDIDIYLHRPWTLTHLGSLCKGQCCFPFLKLPSTCLWCLYLVCAHSRTWILADIAFDTEVKATWSLLDDNKRCPSILSIFAPTLPIIVRGFKDTYSNSWERKHRQCIVQWKIGLRSFQSNTLL